MRTKIPPNLTPKIQVSDSDSLAQLVVLAQPLAYARPASTLAQPLVQV